MAESANLREGGGNFEIEMRNGGGGGNLEIGMGNSRAPYPLVVGCSLHRESRLLRELVVVGGADAVGVGK